MKRVVIAAPTGARLYELSDAEFERFEHVLALQAPGERGTWAQRFLAEREPTQVFPPGMRGLPEGLIVHRAIGGNFFTPKWGRLH